MDKHELPVGFGMALAQDTAAMERFSALPEAERTELVRRARSVSSSDEMHRLVDSLKRRS